ncbi:hypothetical protein GGF46_000169 [Coemansia sp. RSA 552]|nr:hypothetical protein GGF46_000169 [Coemansia sp. RSA 552]
MRPGPLASRTETTVHTQMQGFTRAKPGMDERRVLFDDSANNSLNMISVGLQLHRPQEQALYLRDAHIISSVDMASFFTQLRLADDVADFWTFDGGDQGQTHTKRMVQGNSESPAIAQAFIEHVLRPVPALQGKLLMYIDNAYVKSTTGNMASHIRNIGHLV